VRLRHSPVALDAWAPVPAAGLFHDMLLRLFAISCSTTSPAGPVDVTLIDYPGVGHMPPLSGRDIDDVEKCVRSSCLYNSFVLTLAPVLPSVSQHAIFVRSCSCVQGGWPQRTPLMSRWANAAENVEQQCARDVV
jgi:hypothetical protein